MKGLTPEVKKAMKVLRVIYDLQIGGVQRMLLQSLPLLKEEGIDTQICCLKKEGNMAEAFLKKGIPVHIIPFSSRLDPIGLFRLRRFVFKNNFQIVHAHMYASNMAVNVALIGAKQVRIVNGYHSSRPFHSRSQERMARVTKKIPHRFIAVSQSVKDALLKNCLEEDRIVIIHNGVIAPKQMTPVPEKPGSYPLELVWAGRFVKQKRVDMLVDLVAACKKEDVPVRLTLVGDVPPTSALQRRSQICSWGNGSPSWDGRRISGLISVRPISTFPQAIGRDFPIRFWRYAPRGAVSSVRIFRQMPRRLVPIKRDFF